MNVAIVSQGPSAWLFPGPDTYDLTIGVNWTVNHWACDWWCFADYTAWPRVEDRARRTVPHLFTKYDIGEHLANDADVAVHAAAWAQYGRAKATFEADLKPLPTEVTLPMRIKYSGCYALWLAWHLGATIVDTFGVDLAGTTDWQGAEGETRFCRRETRWARERESWFALCHGLTLAGVAIRMGGLVPWQERKAVLWP